MSTTITQTTRDAQWAANITIRNYQPTPLPMSEYWLWQSPEAMTAVRSGLEQASTGQTAFIGSFEQYADADGGE